MQAIPTPTGLGVLLAGGLVLLAVLAVVTVLLAAGRPVVPWRRIQSVAALLLWVVPALGLVVLVGYRSAAIPTATISTTYSAAVAVPVREARNHAPFESMGGIHEELHSTVTVPAEPRLIADGSSNQSVVTAIEPIPDVNLKPDLTADAALRIKAARSNAASRVEAVVVAAGARQELSTQPFRVRETRTTPPDWADKEPVPSSDGVLVALSSQRFATLGEAAQNVTALAATFIKDFYRDEYPIPGDWSVPVAIIEQHAVDSIVGEEFEKDFGNGPEKMYRAHLRLNMNSSLRNALHASWHDQIVMHRLTVMGSVVGLVTLMLATSAGYFRLDGLTNGQFRGRLKLAAAALIAAGALVAVVA